LITFNGSTNGQAVRYGTSVNVGGLTRKTALIWYNKTTSYVTGQKFLEIAHSPNVGINERYLIFTITSGSDVHIALLVNWSSTSLVYGFDTAGISNGLHHLAITYDASSSSNLPIMYLDATAQSTIGTGASGTWNNTGFDQLAVGGSTNATPSIDANIISVCLYNRILTAAEVASAYQSRLAIPSRTGLVFAPNLSGAAGLQTFSGSLSADNKIADTVSGALGTPNASPVAVADNYLTYKELD
jgi:hypothetical protein